MAINWVVSLPRCLFQVPHRKNIYKLLVYIPLQYIYISPYINNTIHIYIYIKMYPQYIYIYIYVCVCVCFKTIHHLYTNHATILLVKSHGLAICCANSNYFLVLTSLSKITYRPRGLPKPRIPVTLYYQTCFARGTMQ